jgi:hypothetical protein
MTRPEKRLTPIAAGDVLSPLADVRRLARGACARVCARAGELTLSFEIRPEIRPPSVESADRQEVSYL